MKIVAWVFLLLFLGTPILIAAWWLFPILAGICVWALVKFGRTNYAGKLIKPVALVLLFVFVVWLGFIFRRRSVPPSYENGSTAHAIRAVAPPSARSSEENLLLQRERQLLTDAVARERLKITAIGKALELFNSADQVSIIRKKNGIADESGLRVALDGLGKQLAPHKREDGSITPDLLEPAILKDLVSHANEALDRVQTEAEAASETPDQISEKRNRLPKVVSAFEVDPLYGQTANVENALRLALKANLSPVSVYSFNYDRKSDTLTSEQQTIIVLAGQQPVSVDVSDFRPNVLRALKEQITVREDSGPEREFSLTASQLPLHPETQQLTLTRRVYQDKASYKLVTNRVWIPFSGVTLRWPFPLSSSIVLNLRLPEDPSINWPLAVPIRTDATASMQAAYVPRCSFFYSDVPLVSSLPAESSARTEQLVPSPGVPTIADLAADKVIHLELLPWYLSWPVLQNHKTYFFIENVGMAVILALVAFGWALLTSPPK